MKWQSTFDFCFCSLFLLFRLLSYSVCDSLAELHLLSFILNEYWALWVFPSYQDIIFYFKNNDLYSYLVYLLDYYSLKLMSKAIYKLDTSIAAKIVSIICSSYNFTEWMINLMLNLYRFGEISVKMAAVQDREISVNN